MTCSVPVQELKLPSPSRSSGFFQFFFNDVHYLPEYTSHIETRFDCAFSRVRLILRIFHKPNKLVGVFKCTDHVAVKWESDDQANGLYLLFKVVALAEATSNRNAGKELGIQEKLVQEEKDKLPRAMRLILS